MIPNDRLKKLEQDYRHLSELITNPEVLANPSAYQKDFKYYKELTPVIEQIRALEKLSRELDEAIALSQAQDTDPGLKKLAEEEIGKLITERGERETRLEALLAPRDEGDTYSSLIMEIRAGVGGDEAAIFVSDLYRLYSRYAEDKGWKLEVMNSHPIGRGGFKEIILSISGKGAYKRLCFESGVHRVQRVPITEASGRIHTSTATVAVLPEPEDVDVHIKPEELRIDIFRASGPGGQGVNTTDSAIRITHLPTGTVVTCQDERSQHKNKAKAMRVLKARLLAMEKDKRSQKIAAERRGQIGSGDRSEKIRTYNFPQNRLTDHRIGLSIYNLDEIMEGRIDKIIDALINRKKEE